MNYEITFEDETIELPAYTFGIQDTLETISKTVNIKDKCDKIYKLLADKILGKQEVKDKFGDFKNCDPNRLLIIFTDIKDCYGGPIMDKTYDSVVDTIERCGLDKMSTLGDVLGKIDKVMQEKK